jgi:hypothetical protein
MKSWQLRGPTLSRVATTALLGSRSQTSAILARNVSAAGNERCWTAGAATIPKPSICPHRVRT